MLSNNLINFFSAKLYAQKSTIVYSFKCVNCDYVSTNVCLACEKTSGCCRGNITKLPNIVSLQTNVSYCRVVPSRAIVIQ